MFSVTCCRDKYPSHLISEWDRWNEEHSSENDRPGNDITTCSKALRHIINMYIFAPILLVEDRRGVTEMVPSDNANNTYLESIRCLIVPVNGLELFRQFVGEKHDHAFGATICTCMR